MLAFLTTVTALSVGFAQVAVSFVSAAAVSTAASAAASTSASALGGAPRVDTGYAIYVGNHSRPNTAAFLGLPYAEPPVGEGRFRAPIPLDTEKLRSQKAVVDASQYPEFCVQGTTGNGDAGTFFFSRERFTNFCSLCDDGV